MARIPLLITKSQAQEFVQIADGLSLDQFNRNLIKAQEFDFKEMLPDAFYYDLLQNKEDAKYVALMNSNSFEIDGRTYYHQGINAVLAYLTYSRLLMSENVVSTSHGVVTKKSQQSDPVSYALLKDQSRDARLSAGKAMESVIFFIKSNQNDYLSYFNNSSCGSEVVPTAIKTSVIK